MCILMTIVSFLSLLLLLVPASVTRIIEIMILFAFGVVLIVQKKPMCRSSLKDKKSLVVAIPVVAYLSFCFCKRWIPNRSIRTIFAMFHMSTEITVAIGSVIISILAIYFLCCMIQKIKHVISEPPEGREIERDLWCCLIAAVITVILSQIMIGVEIFSMGIFKFLVATLIVSVVILVLYCLSGNMKISVVLATLIFIFISTINVYVYSFRSRLFEPVDIFSAGTALNVADNYSLLPVPTSIIVCWILWGVLMGCLIFCYMKEKIHISHKWRMILSLFCVITAIAVSFYTANLETYPWKKDGAKNNGYILEFFSKWKEMRPTKPEEYSIQQINKLAEQYAPDYEIVNTEKDNPHLIVIMNEAFSDLSAVGKISTNTEVTPFISSMKKDVISGYALASVYGGNTANSEYEFLTGNSMAWLHLNAVPYQQYIRSSMYSVVSYLKSRHGYRCITMHPYLSNGWSRPNVYRHLGFDESFYVEDFPQKDYIRKYISDREMFEKIIDTYENRQEEQLFIFGVSMQNHGGYSYSGDNFNQTISLVGYEKNYPEVEQYLSLIYETDKAVEHLISYFERVDDDVVVVFFGDHQPKFNKEIYSEICENNLDSLDEKQDIYKVPFFIWSNYDIDEKYIECTSLNYLSSYMYEVAGISLPPYNCFLSDMEKVIPSMNANGFYSMENGEYLPFDMASEKEEKWLKRYEMLQYNSLFDNKNRNRKLFYNLE